MTKQQKQLIAALSAMLFMGEVIGLIISVLNQLKKGNPWYYVFKAYTQDSNIISMFSAFVLLLATIKALRSESEISHKARVFRYVTTCLTTVTFLIVLVVLMPNKDPEVGGFMHNFFSGSLFWYHGFCPILALLMFLFFEGKHDLRAKNIILAIIPTFLYAIVWVSLVSFNIVPDEDAPYPFLRVHQQSVSTSVMWCCIILGVAAVVATVLFFIGREKSVSKNETTEE